jgi:tetraacyldisaccharide 4'-kinase
MKGLKFLLFPFAVCFDVITRIRNRLYDLGYKPVASFDVMTVCVGNLSVGGTGKSPMIEHLIRILRRENVKVATLSRGYGRTTKGVRIARENDTAATIGDEPFQFYKKFSATVPVAVGEERALAIPYIMDEYPDTEVILLDDAFQHRAVKADVQLMLTDYNNLFFSDYILPVGYLRESKSGAARASGIIVTKCPVEIDEEKMMSIENQIQKFSSAPVFFSTIRYGEFIHFGRKRDQGNDNVVIVSGIANDRPLVNFLSQNNHKIKDHLAFNDHHNYTRKDVARMSELASTHNAMIITTEKDFVKLSADGLKDLISSFVIAYLPIEIDFIKSGKDFDEMILDAVKNPKKID